MATKLLILTQYWPPEVGAPQNRLYELGKILHASGVAVTVLTAMPNYPEMRIHKGYRDKFYTSETMDGMRVVRSWIYASKGRGVVSRLLNYFSFVFSAMWVGVFMGRAHIIMCESPPLFLGITAYWLKLWHRAKVIFNVSDLWPESAEKLGIVKNRTMLNMATGLEEYCYRNAALVTGQTQGICTNISGRFPNKKVYWLPNGVDPTLFDPQGNYKDWRAEYGFSSEDIVILYAGIHGHAQGLEVIVEAARSLGDLSHVKFVMVGDGPEKKALESMAAGLDNISFLGVQPKSEMPHIVHGCSLSVVPLRRLDLFKGAIPSKIFEILAMERPVLLGVEGEAKDIFIDKGGAGVAFEPENVESLVSAVRSLAADPHRITQMGQAGRRVILDQFDRRKIASGFLEQIKEVHHG